MDRINKQSHLYAHLIFEYATKYTLTILVIVSPRREFELPSKFIKRLPFHNGRTHSIDKKRIFDFENKAVLDRYYFNRNIEAATLLEDLGPIQIDFTNTTLWSQEIPDIDPRSARIFSLWAEDEETKEIVVLVHGFVLVLAMRGGKEALQDYYYYTENVPYAPTAVISSFRTIVKDDTEIDDLFERVTVEIELLWQEMRKRVIETLDKNSELWKRYILSFDKIINFSFLCSSVDRSLISSLRRKNFSTTGVLQILTSPPSSAYDRVKINTHLKEAQKLIADYDDSK